MCPGGMTVGTGKMPNPQKDGNLMTDWLRGEKVGKESELASWFLTGVSSLMVAPYNHTGGAVSSQPPEELLVGGEDDGSHGLHCASHRPARAQIQVGHYSISTSVRKTELDLCQTHSGIISVIFNIMHCESEVVRKARGEGGNL